jgi:RecB family exonuclease
MSDFFSTEAIALGPWSTSKLGTLEQCPYKFDLQYVEKIKERDIPVDLKEDVDDSALRYGNSVHKLSELVATGEDIHSALEKTSKENQLTVVEKKQLKAAKSNVLSFEDRVAAFKEKFHVAEDLTEQDLAVDRYLEKCKYFSKNAVLRGKVDRLLITADGKTAIVIDLKTGRKATLKYSAAQLDFYTTLVLSTYPEITLVRSALYFTRLGTMLWDTPKHRKDYSLDSTNSVINKVNSLSLDFISQEDSQISVQSLCKWCVYKGLCKTERKRRLKKK